MYGIEDDLESTAASKGGCIVPTLLLTLQAGDKTLTVDDLIEALGPYQGLRLHRVVFYHPLGVDKVHVYADLVKVPTKIRTLEDIPVGVWKLPLAGDMDFWRTLPVPVATLNQIGVAIQSTVSATGLTQHLKRSLPTT